MAHWLFKTEPSTWSWDDQVAAAEKGTFWNGVRNHSAKLQMMAMKIGDQGFLYHSVDEKRIMGIVEVIREYYPDHTDPKGVFGMVDIKAVSALPRPVTLAEIKDQPKLDKMALVTNSRLSVQPVTDAEWKLIVKMAKS